MLSLTKYNPKQDLSLTLFVKSQGVLEVNAGGLDDKDKLRFSLKVSEQEVDFHISVVNPHDGGIYRLIIRKDGDIQSLGLAALNVVDKKFSPIPTPPPTGNSMYRPTVLFMVAY